MRYDQHTARTLYRKLLRLYPRAFREQLGESLEQTFNDLCNERKRRAKPGWLGFVLWIFAETGVAIVREHALHLRQGGLMRISLTNARSVAIISCLLCLPFVLLFSLLILNIEPNFGPLEPWLNNPDPDQPDVGGSLLALSTILLVLVAFIINLIPIVRSVRAGRMIMERPMHLVLAIATLSAILLVIGLIVEDQYPCWIGVPNCD